MNNFLKASLLSLFAILNVEASNIVNFDTVNDNDDVEITATTSTGVAENNTGLLGQAFAIMDDLEEKSLNARLNDKHNENFLNEIKQDADKVLSLLSKAVDLGMTEAARILGDIYLDGEIVKQNYSLAKKYYEIMGNLGAVAESDYHIALLYENGYGVEKALDEALKLYKKSYNAGYKQALCAFMQIASNGEVKIILIR